MDLIVLQSRIRLLRAEVWSYFLRPYTHRVTFFARNNKFTKPYNLNKNVHSAEISICTQTVAHKINVI